MFQLVCVIWLSIGGFISSLVSPYVLIVLFELDPAPTKKYGKISRPAHVHVHCYPLEWRQDLMCFYSTHICWTSWSSRCLKKGIVPRIVPDIAKEFHDFHSSHTGQVIVFLWHTKDSTKWRLGPEIHGKFGDRHLQMPYLHTNVIRTISGCPMRTGNSP